MQMKITQHARDRISQRRIPQRLLGLLLTHGSAEPAHTNRTLWYFSTKDLKVLGRELPSEDFARVLRHKKMYIITAAEYIVTAGRK